MSAMVQRVFTNSGFILNVLKSHFDPGPEREFIGYLVNCSQLWGKGNVGYLSPTVKRLTALTVSANRLVRSKRTSPRKLAKLAGYIVSLRPVYDPASLLFTKDMYRWIQQLVDCTGLGLARKTDSRSQNRGSGLGRFRRALEQKSFVVH